MRKRAFRRGDCSCWCDRSSFLGFLVFGGIYCYLLIYPGYRCNIGINCLLGWGVFLLIGVLSSRLSLSYIFAYLLLIPGAPWCLVA